MLAGDVGLDVKRTLSAVLELLSMRTSVSWPGSLCSPQTLRCMVLGAVTEVGHFSAVGVTLGG